MDTMNPIGGLPSDESVRRLLRAIGLGIVCSVGILAIGAWLIWG